MNQHAALVKVILYFRELPEGEQAVAGDKDLARAVKQLERRAEILRVRNQRRRTAEMCRCGEHRASNVVCWACWLEVNPIWRKAFETGDDKLKRSALRQILAVADRRRERSEA